MSSIPIVWSWGQYEAAICDWVTLLYGNGGMMADEAGNPVFNNEVGVKTLEWMVKTIDDGITNPSSISYVEEDVRNVFSQGKAVFALNWNYMFDLANFKTDQSQITGQVKMAPDARLSRAVALKAPRSTARWASRSPRLPPIPMLPGPMWTT